MNPLRIIVIALAIVVMSSSAASAQERGQIGIGMGYPGSISLVWHITDTIAVRPDLVFRAGSSEGVIAESSSTSVGVGFSGLVYVSRHDHLGLYLSPRYAYSHSSTKATESLFANFSPQEIALLGPFLSLPPTLTVETTSTTHLVSGSFGAQYAVHKRFSVFGEAGFSYATNHVSSSVDSALTIFGRPDQDGPRSWGTQSAVGVIVYFKD